MTAFSGGFMGKLNTKQVGGFERNLWANRGSPHMSEAGVPGAEGPALLGGSHGQGGIFCQTLAQG